MFDKLRSFFCAPDKQLVAQVQKLGYPSVALFGAGDLGLSVYMQLQSKGIEVSAWFDSKVDETPCRYIDTELKSPSSLTSVAPSILVIASEAYAKEIKQTCLALGFQGQFISLTL